VPSDIDYRFDSALFEVSLLGDAESGGT